MIPRPARADKTAARQHADAAAADIPEHACTQVWAHETEWTGRLGRCDALASIPRKMMT
jgi:hypothetical protein